MKHHPSRPPRLLSAIALLAVLTALTWQTASSEPARPAPFSGITKLDGKPLSTITNKKDGSVLVDIPAGDFWMGLELKDGVTREETPRHKVSVTHVYMGRYLVTNAQYATFLKQTGYILQGQWSAEKVFGEDRHPVTMVTWKDAAAYCDWAGGRLPSEAEWEKAARGLDGRIYPWGDDYDPNACNSSTESPSRGTMPVGSFPAGVSPYGLMDMAGNAGEWTDDWFHPYPGAATEEADPADRYRTVRGGSWRDRDASYYRTTYRTRWAPDHSDPGIGFRYVMDPGRL